MEPVQPVHTVPTGRCKCYASIVFCLIHSRSSPYLILTCTSSDKLDDEDDDVIHMGHAIMTFYSALIDLLGRCAPETHVSVSENPLGKLDKSLIMCLKDLVGKGLLVLSTF